MDIREMMKMYVGILDGHTEEISKDIVKKALGLIAELEDDIKYWAKQADDNNEDRLYYMGCLNRAEKMFEEELSGNKPICRLCILRHKCDNYVENPIIPSEDGCFMFDHQLYNDMIFAEAKRGKRKENRMELKPCPFCGGEAELKLQYKPYPKLWCECKNCDSHTMGFCPAESRPSVESFEECKNAAIELWNTREGE